MKQITVTPEQLDSCAARMDEMNQEYVRNTHALFAAVEEMGSAWHGRDNTAFATQISSFQSDFREISVLCSQYTDFLRNSARAYRSTEEELMAAAQGLRQ